MRTSTSPPSPIKCKCGSVIGEVIVISGQELFHSGGGVFRDVRGWCAQCGNQFYWSVTDKQLQAIIKGAQVESQR